MSCNYSGTGVAGFCEHSTKMNVLTSWVTVSVSLKTVYHGVRGYGADN